MKPSYRRRLLVLFLALFVGLGMIMSTVQANSMTIKMVVMADGDPADGADCDGCGGVGGESTISICMPVCGSACLAVIPVGMDVCDIGLSNSVVSMSAYPSGFSRIPDPSPPKPAT